MFSLRNRFLTKVFLLMFPCFLFACKQTVPPEKETGGLLFQESSTGLPTGGMWRNGLAFYDFNGDGLMDVFAPAPRKAEKGYAVPAGWLQKKGGTWDKMRLDVPGDIVYDYGDISVNDLNADGVADLVLAMHSRAMTLLLGTERGTYTNGSAGLPPEDVLTSRAVSTADLTNDGKMDIIACSEAPFSRKKYKARGIYVCFQEASGRYGCNPLVEDPGGSSLFSDQLRIGDVNGDGNKDLAIAMMTGPGRQIVWVGDGKGGFKPFDKGLPQKKLFACIAVADVNGDGCDDLIASVSGYGRGSVSGPRVFLGGSGGFTEMSRGLPEKLTFRAVAAGDLDGDGDVEIIGAEESGVFSIYSQEGGTWKKQVVSGLPDAGRIRVYNAYCVDVNNDGKKDIVFNHASENYETGGIRVFLNES